MVDLNRFRIGAVRPKSFSTYSINRNIRQSRDPRVLKKMENQKSQLALAIQKVQMMKKRTAPKVEQEVKQHVQGKYDEFMSQMKQRKDAVIMKSDQQIRKDLQRAQQLNRRLKQQNARKQETMAEGNPGMNPDTHGQPEQKASEMPEKPSGEDVQKPESDDLNDVLGQIFDSSK